MQASGHVQNGVVVLDEGASLPEGTRVHVTVAPLDQVKPEVECLPGQLPKVSSRATTQKCPPTAPTKNRVEFPLVRAGIPGSLHLTNERIHEIFDQEEIEALKAQGNVLT